MDQHAVVIAEPDPGIGHNRSPEAITPQALEQAHRDLAARFANLELGCVRVPERIENSEEAGLVTDFIAQCQTHLRRAESAHKQEKAPFLNGGRIVDTFFKRRCERLSEALAPVLARLKAYRDRMSEAERARHESARQAAKAEARRAAEEEVRYRAEAERLARAAQTTEERRRAGERLALAETAAARAREARQRASLPLAPARIQGDYGAIAYVTASWSFEVIDLDKVPRAYLCLDTERVRSAITKEGVRAIAGLPIYEREELRVRGA